MQYSSAGGNATRWVVRGKNETWLATGSTSNRFSLEFADSEASGWDGVWKTEMTPCRECRVWNDILRTEKQASRLASNVTKKTGTGQGLIVFCWGETSGSVFYPAEILDGRVRSTLIEQKLRSEITQRRQDKKNTMDVLIVAFEPLSSDRDAPLVGPGRESNRDTADANADANATEDQVAVVGQSEAAASQPLEMGPLRKGDRAVYRRGYPEEEVVTVVKVDESFVPPAYDVRLADDTVRSTERHFLSPVTEPQAAATPYVEQYRRPQADGRAGPTRLSRETKSGQWIAAARAPPEKWDEEKRDPYSWWPGAETAMDGSIHPGYGLDLWSGGGSWPADNANTNAARTTGSLQADAPDSGTDTKHASVTGSTVAGSNVNVSSEKGKEILLHDLPLGEPESETGPRPGAPVITGSSGDNERLLPDFSLGTSEDETEYVSGAPPVPDTSSDEGLPVQGAPTGTTEYETESVSSVASYSTDTYDDEEIHIRVSPPDTTEYETESVSSVASHSTDTYDYSEELHTRGSLPGTSEYLSGTHDDGESRPMDTGISLETDQNKIGGPPTQRTDATDYPSTYGSSYGDDGDETAVSVKEYEIRAVSKRIEDKIVAAKKARRDDIPPSSRIENVLEMARADDSKMSEGTKASIDAELEECTSGLVAEMAMLSRTGTHWRDFQSVGEAVRLILSRRTPDATGIAALAAILVTPLDVSDDVINACVATYMAASDRADRMAFTP
jgi:hypothetical protein